MFMRSLFPVYVPVDIAGLIVRVAWGDGPHPTQDDWDQACGVCSYIVLTRASKHGHLAIVEYVLYIHRYINADFALNAAAEFNHMDVVRRLAQDSTCLPLTAASMHGHMEMVKWIVQQGVNKCDLNWACEKAFYCDQLEIAKYLLDSGVDVRFVIDTCIEADLWEMLSWLREIDA